MKEEEYHECEYVTLHSIGFVDWDIASGGDGRLEVFSRHVLL